jgi:hypothetical protein
MFWNCETFKYYTYFSKTNITLLLVMSVTIEKRHLINGFQLYIRGPL